MGSLYRPKYRDRNGECQQSAVWWLKYRMHGRVLRESSGTESEQQARRLLKRREGAVEEGRPIIPRAERLTVEQLAEGLRQDYQANRRRSADRLEFSLAHLLPVFGARRAVLVTATDVTAYVVQRQTAGAANATINRELAALKKMYTLALVAERIPRAPRFRMLQEDNVRQGFFERDRFEAVRAALPDYLQPIVTFAYITGWRIPSEVLPLSWLQIDFTAGTVRLEPGTTKNREGRLFIMTPELRAWLERQRAITEALEQRTGRAIPWVFHRRGRRIGSFRKSWAAACRAAGVAGRIPHDFRRT